MIVRKNPARPVEFDRSQEFRWSPDYGNGITAGVAIAAHQRHILTDGLGDHDAVERVTMVIGQRHHAQRMRLQDRQNIDPVCRQAFRQVDIQRFALS